MTTSEEYNKMNEIDKIDDMIAEADYRLYMLQQSKPRQSEIKFREAVLERCKNIKAKIETYYKNK
jgi:hypothetical protein